MGEPERLSDRCVISSVKPSMQTHGLHPSQHGRIIQLSPLSPLNVSQLNQYITAFIFIYHSCGENFGITYSLKILTCISLTPNTLKALLINV